MSSSLSSVDFLILKPICNASTMGKDNNCTGNTEYTQTENKTVNEVDKNKIEKNHSYVENETSLISQNVIFFHNQQIRHQQIKMQ